MKAITVWQPWATLLATGQKHNETRSWKTSYRGEILIHAAKTDHSGILLHIPMEELKHFQNAGVVNKLPTGAIIGKVNLVDCFQIDEAKFGEHKICGCVLSAPDDWDEPKVIGHVVRTIIHEMAGGKK